MNPNRFQQCTVITAAFFIIVIVYGNDIGFAVFLTPLLDTFGKSRSLTSTIHAMLHGVHGTFGIVSGLITAKLGITKTMLLGSTLLTLGYITSYFVTSLTTLYVTIGVLGGIGNSLLFNASVSTAGRTFTGKLKGVAVCLITVGINTGGLIFPELLHFLVTRFGLKGAFLLTGGIVFNSFTAILIIKVISGNKADCKEHANSTDNTLDKPGIRGQLSLDRMKRLKHDYFGWMKGPLILIIFGTSISFGTIQSLQSLAVDVLIWKGAGEEDGVMFTTVLTSIGIALKLALAVKKYFWGYSWNVSVFMLMIYCLLAAVGMGIMVGVDTRDAMIVGAALAGVAYGLVMVHSLTVLMEHIPQDHISTAVGILHTCTGVITLSTIPLFGHMYDRTGSYLSVLISLLGLQILSVIFYLCALITYNCTRKGNWDIKT